MRYNFLLCGQSNISGRGLLSELPADQSQVFPNIARIFLYGNDGIWKQGYEPTDDPTNQVDSRTADTGTGDSAVGTSPGMAFANRMLDLLPAGSEVGLIPCAKGSEEISAFRRVWSREYIYGVTMARAYEASLMGPIAGIVWGQGESDTLDANKAAYWRENFSNLVADMRTDLKNLSLPIVYYRLNNKSPANHPYWSTVRHCQEVICMDKVAWVDCDDRTFKSDKMHFTTADQLVMGARFADAMFSLMQ